MDPTPDVQGSQVVHVEINAGSSQFVTLSTDGEVHTADFPSGNNPRQLVVPGMVAGSVFYARGSGNLFVGQSSGQLSLWDPESYHRNGLSAQGHTQKIIGTTITADGRLLATLGRDQLIRFWTLGDHYPLATSWPIEAKSARAVAISHDVCVWPPVMIVVVYRFAVWIPVTLH